MVAAAAASSAAAAENDADPNEAFIPTNDDNDTNRPAFKLLTQEDLERHSVLSFWLEYVFDRFTHYGMKAYFFGKFFKIIQTFEHF